MTIQFSKFHGTGNDFIIIDNRRKDINLSADCIRMLCSRHTGIGADGLIMAEIEENFLFMRYFNSDGNEATMCGNGGRCLAAWAVMMGLATKEINFLAADGNHEADVESDGEGKFMVRLTMSDICDFKILSDGYFVQTGTPHFVQFVENPDAVDLLEEGRRLRFDERFDGVNVNFVAAKEDGIYVRTYEKGVEDETLSCGTGVTASAIAAMFELGLERNEWKILTKGGILSVKASFNGVFFSDIILQGPAQFVFSGKINAKAR